MGVFSRRAKKCKKRTIFIIQWTTWKEGVEKICSQEFLLCRYPIKWWSLFQNCSKNECTYTIPWTKPSFQNCNVYIHIHYFLIIIFVEFFDRIEYRSRATHIIINQQIQMEKWQNKYLKSKKVEWRWKEDFSIFLNIPK